MNKASVNRYPRPEAGFTLLEVLVAVLVLAIGVIGMAGLQFASLRNNTQSLQRSQAAALTNELADLMRANRAAAAPVSSTGTAAYVLAVGTTLSVPGASCDAVTCSGAQTAAFDEYRWQQRVLAALPGAKTRVACSVATTCVRGTLQTITVMWDETHTGATGTGCGTDLTTDLSCYSMSLTP